jgi:predicted Abi (CAAX) family protease
VTAWLRTRAGDVAAGVTTVPTGADWARAAACYAAFLIAALPIGLLSGLLHVDPVAAAPAAVLAEAAILLVHPAFVEELIFRVVLLPGRCRTWSVPQRAGLSAAALAVFVAAHPVNGLLFMPSALALFTNPWYLALAALLGAACTVTYLSSGSIWPGVVIHWVSVVIWIFLLGGRRLLEPAAGLG